MFSVEEKRRIAEVVEIALLDIKHPEMPEEKPKFELHVNGKEDWSFADIEPNWIYEDKELGVNPWNEHVRELMKK